MRQPATSRTHHDHRLLHSISSCGSLFTIRFPRPSSLVLISHPFIPAAAASRDRPTDTGSLRLSPPHLTSGPRILISLSLPLLLTHSYSHTLLPHNRSPAAPSQQHPLAAGAPLLSSSIICYSIFLPLPSSLDSPACATTASHTALTAAASAANERINAVTLHQLQEDGRPSSLRKIYST